MFFNNNSYQAIRTLSAAVAAILTKCNPVTMVTVLDPDEKKNAWVKEVTENGDFTNPSFSYDVNYLQSIADARPTLIQARVLFNAAIITENDADKAIKRILLNRIATGLLCSELATAMLAGDDKASASINKELYGFPSEAQVEKVLDGLKNPAPKATTLFDEETAARLKAIKVDATAIKYWFEKALSAAGIEGWSVEISSEFTAIDVQDFSKAGYPRIAIPASRQIDGLKLVSLIMHEILGHARGSAEGWKLFGNLLKDTPIESLIPVMTKSHDETLYEGVAMRLEHAITGTEPLPWATISCSNCPNTNFAELGKIMYQYRLEGGAKPEKAASLAYTNAYRLKRGCTDSGAVGYAFPKDPCYRKGFDLVPHLDPAVLTYSTLSVPEAQLIVSTFKTKPSYTLNERAFILIMASEIITNS